MREWSLNSLQKRPYLAAKVCQRGQNHGVGAEASRSESKRAAPAWMESKA